MDYITRTLDVLSLIEVLIIVLQKCRILLEISSFSYGLVICNTFIVKIEILRTSGIASTFILVKPSFTGSSAATAVIVVIFSVVA